jgi:methylphosphotriester-DNA--protein-cysteine methyltransferase
MKIITILGIKLAGLREILEARVGIEPKTMLKAQKLLILLNAINAKNTESAQAGYTAA